MFLVLKLEGVLNICFRMHSFHPIYEFDRVRTCGQRARELMTIATEERTRHSDIGATAAADITVLATECPRACTDARLVCSQSPFVRLENQAIHAK